MLNFFLKYRFFKIYFKFFILLFTTCLVHSQNIKSENSFQNAKKSFDAFKTTNKIDDLISSQNTIDNAISVNGLDTFDVWFLKGEIYYEIYSSFNQGKLKSNNSYTNSSYTDALYTSFLAFDSASEFSPLNKTQENSLINYFY